MSDTMHPEEPMTDQPQSSESDQPVQPPAAEVASARPTTPLTALASGHADDPAAGRETVFELQDVTISYSGKPAVRHVDLSVHRNLVTAFIGPSGCGKTNPASQSQPAQRPDPKRHHRRRHPLPR